MKQPPFDLFFSFLLVKFYVHYNQFLHKSTFIWLNFFFIATKIKA